MTKTFPLPAAGSGPVAVTLLAVALLLPGAPVRTDQPVRQLAGMLATQRTAFALSIFLAGLGLLALCIFAASLYRFMASAERELAGLAAAVAIVSGGVLIVVGMSAFSGLTINPVDASHGDLAVVRAAVDIGNVVIGLAKFTFAGMILCVVVGAPNVIGTTMRATGAVAAVGVLFSALPPLLATGGIGQFGGALDLIGSGLALLWIFAFSVLVTTRSQRSAPPV